MLTLCGPRSGQRSKFIIKYFCCRSSSTLADTASIIALLLCYQYRKLKAQAKSLDSLQEAYSTLLAEKEHLERECTDLVAAETENQEKIRGLEERIEGMEKEYESLEKKHLEVEPMVYAEERLEELRQENKDLDEALAEERQRLEDLQQGYEKVVDELEELKESRDIDMLDTE